MENRSEGEHGGDPIPSIPRRRRKQSLALPVLVLLTLALSGYNTYNATGVFHGNFPGTQPISIIATYSFGSFGQQVLAAGVTGNFSLGVTYAGTVPSTLRLSFNATNAGVNGAYSYHGLVGQGDFTGAYTIRVNGQVIQPINSPLGCNNAECFATVTAVHGSNQFPGSISVSPSATVDSFTLSWFADQ